MINTKLFLSTLTLSITFSGEVLSQDYCDPNEYRNYLTLSQIEKSSDRRASKECAQWLTNMNTITPKNQNKTDVLSFGGVASLKNPATIVEGCDVLTTIHQLPVEIYFESHARNNATAKQTNNLPLGTVIRFEIPDSYNSVECECENGESGWACY